MSSLHLKIITPKKVVQEEDIYSVTLPTADGVITVLPRHEALFSLLVEGIIKIKHAKEDVEEDYLAIGGGYLETDGKHMSILVSRAYGQDEIDEEFTKKAMEEAQKVLSEAKDEHQIKEASAIMRRSIIDMKLIRRKKHGSS